MKNQFLRYISIFVFILLSKINLAQNKSWILAPHYIPNTSNPSFQFPLPTPLGGYQNQPATGAQNIQTDASGNILFFIVDDKIYARDGSLIETLTGSESNPLNGELSETLVLPDLVDCNLFHIVSTTTAQYNGTRAQYCRLRVSYNSQGIINPNSGIVLAVSEDCASGYTDFSTIVGSIWGSDDDSNVNKPLFAAMANGVPSWRGFAPPKVAKK